MGLFGLHIVGNSFMYPQKVRMLFFPPNVDPVLSDILCAQCCGDTRTIGKSGV